MDEQLKEKMAELEERLAQIQKSTRTTWPALIPLHDKMRMKFRWYYNWHCQPKASIIHWGILSFYCLALIVGAAVGTFGGKTVLVQAATTTYNWTGGGDGVSFADGANWDIGSAPAANTAIAVINTSSSSITTASGSALTLGELQLGSNFTGVVTLGNTLTLSTAGGATGNITIDGPATLDTSNRIVTVGGDLAINAGNLIGSNSLTVNGGDMTGDGTINRSGGTTTLTGTGNFGGATIWTFASLVFGSVTTTTVTTATGSGGITITNTFNLSGTSLGGHPATLNTGSKTWAFTGNIQSPMGSGALTSGNTLNVDTSTFVFSGNAAGANTNIRGVYNYYNLVLNNASETYDINAANLTVTHDLTVTAGTLDSTTGNRNITIGGSFSNSGTYNARNATVTFNATSTGKTLAGTLTSAGSSAFYNLTFNGIGGGWTLSNDTEVANVLTVANGTLNGASATLTLSGTTGTPLTNAATFNADSSTVSYSGANSSGNTTVANVSYHHLTLNAADTFVLAADTTVGGDLTISSGILDAVSGQNYNLTVGGNLSNSGTYTAQNNTVTLNGSAKQTLSGIWTGSSTFYNLTITNISGSADPGCGISFTPSIDFNVAASASNNFTITTAAVKVEFNSGSTYTFNNINWNGQATGTPILMRNSNLSSGTWLLDVSGSQTAVQFVNVARSDASDGDNIDATTAGNTDCNNNTNWTFPATPTPTPSPIPTSTATVDTNSSGGSNIATGSTPTPTVKTTNNQLVIINPNPDNPLGNIKIKITGLTILARQASGVFVQAITDKNSLTNVNHFHGFPNQQIVLALPTHLDGSTVAKAVATINGVDYVFQPEDGHSSTVITLPPNHGQYDIKLQITNSAGQTIDQQEQIKVIVDPYGFAFTKVADPIQSVLKALGLRDAVDYQELHLNKVTVSLYAYNEATKAWQIWNATEFGQENPQITGTNGGYNFFVPPGRYYLAATKPGYQDYRSAEFVVEQNIVNMNLELQSAVSTRVWYIVNSILVLLVIVIALIIVRRRRTRLVN